MASARVEQFNLIWERMTQEKRIELIRALKFNESFSLCNSLQEMAQRGGSWLARDLLMTHDKLMNGGL